MRPTWLERKRGLLLSQGLTHMLVQPLIFIGCSYLFGPSATFWGSTFNFSITMAGATLVAFAAVGYRRHVIRMRGVLMYLLVNGLEEHGVYGLYVEGIIDYKALKRLVPENVIVSPTYLAPWWKVWA